MDLSIFAEHFANTVTPLVRTDFTDDTAWSKVVASVNAPLQVNEPDPDVPGDDGTYIANIAEVVDPAFAGTTADALTEAWRPHRDAAMGYVLLADERSMREAVAGDEITVLYLDLYAEDEDAELGWIYGNTFRCVAGEVASVEANLSISNMDFSEFADGASEGDGVFRGFGD